MPREPLDDAPFDVDEKPKGILVSTLQHALEPIRLACEKKSVVPDFRFLQVKPDYLSIIGSMAKIKVNIDLGFTSEFAVDAQAFCGIVMFLDKSKYVEFELKDGVLNWRSGKARGKLATAEPKDFNFSFILKPKEWWHDPLSARPAFGELLKRGSVSGDNNMLAGGKLNGCVLYPNGPQSYCVSSDNATIAVADADIEIPSDVPIYLHHTSIPLLVELSKREGTFHFNDKAVAFQGDKTVAVIAQLAPYEGADFLQTAEKFAEGNMTAEINKDALLLYTKRVAELSERSNRGIVKLTVTSSGITLNFSEGLIENEEDFDIANMEDLPSSMVLRIGANNLSKALSYCNKVVLDHVDKKVLTFKGDNFQFMVAGSAQVVTA